MEQSFENYQSSTPNQSDSMPAGSAAPMGDKRSSIATSVERVVNTGADRAHGAIDASQSALQSGVRQADEAVADVKNKVGDAVNRVAQNPQVEEMTRGLEQQVREHPVRTLALAVGLGILVGRSLK